MMHTQGNASADAATEQQRAENKNHGRRRIKWNRAAGVLVGLVGLGAFLLLLGQVIVGTALDPVRIAQLKTKARGIWGEILSISMMERDAPWPADVKWGTPPEAVQWDSASQYFRYLMSDDNPAVNPLRAIPTDNEEERLATDLTPILIAGAGVPTAPSVAEFDDSHCAWHVCVIGENAPGNVPFLISKNVHVENGRIVLEGDGSKRVPLDRRKPFGKRRAVWVTKGGGIFDARAVFVTQSLLLGSTNEIRVIPCR